MFIRRTVRAYIFSSPMKDTRTKLEVDKEKEYDKQTGTVRISKEI